jgi:hypothetical protein
LRKVLSQVEEGAVPKLTMRETLHELQNLQDPNPLQMLAIIQKNVSQRFLQGHYVEGSDTAYSREVILSEYLIKENE